MMHQFRLNGLRSAIQSASQAYSSKYRVQQVPLFKQSQGAAHGGPHTLVFSLGARTGILGHGRLHVQPLGAARTLSSCLSSPSSCSSPSALPLVSISIVPRSPTASVQPGPAHAPQPATSSEAATRNYNQLLRAAGWPALQTSILIPQVPGRQRPALGSSTFAEGIADTLGRTGSSASLSCGSWRPVPVRSPLSCSQRELFLLLAGSCHLQLPSTHWPIVCAGAASSGMVRPSPDSGTQASCEHLGWGSLQTRPERWG